MPGSELREPTSSLRVAVDSPIRAITAGGDTLDGILTVTGGQLSPSVLCYLWLWAVIHASDGARGMDFRFMRHAVRQLGGREGGLQVLFGAVGQTRDIRLEEITLLLPDDEKRDRSDNLPAASTSAKPYSAPQVDLDDSSPGAEAATASAAGTPSADSTQRASDTGAAVVSPKWYMLITLEPGSTSRTRGTSLPGAARPTPADAGTGTGRV